jgi:hypothetical protein
MGGDMSEINRALEQLSGTLRGMGDDRARRVEAQAMDNLRMKQLGFQGEQAKARNAKDIALFEYKREREAPTTFGALQNSRYLSPAARAKFAELAATKLPDGQAVGDMPTTLATARDDFRELMAPSQEMDLYKQKLKAKQELSPDQPKLITVQGYDKDGNKKTFRVAANQAGEVALPPGYTSGAPAKEPTMAELNAAKEAVAMMTEGRDGERISPADLAVLNRALRTLGQPEVRESKTTRTRERLLRPDVEEEVYEYLPAEEPAGATAEEGGGPGGDGAESAGTPEDEIFAALGGAPTPQPDAGAPAPEPGSYQRQGSNRLTIPTSKKKPALQIDPSVAEGGPQSGPDPYAQRESSRAALKAIASGTLSAKDMTAEQMLVAARYWQDRGRRLPKEFETFLKAGDWEKVRDFLLMFERDEPLTPLQAAPRSSGGRTY